MENITEWRAVATGIVDEILASIPPASSTRARREELISYLVREGSANRDLSVGNIERYLNLPESAREVSLSEGIPLSIDIIQVDQPSVVEPTASGESQFPADSATASPTAEGELPGQSSEGQSRAIQRHVTTMNPSDNLVKSLNRNLECQTTNDLRTIDDIPCFICSGISQWSGAKPPIVTSARVFISAIERQCQGPYWTDVGKIKAVGKKTFGPAAESHEYAIEVSNNDWEVYKEAFLEWFPEAESLSRVLHEIESAERGKTETLEQFMLRLISLARKARVLQEDTWGSTMGTVRTVFLRGLPEEFRATLRNVHSMPPSKVLYHANAWADLNPRYKLTTAEIIRGTTHKSVNVVKGSTQDKSDRAQVQGPPVDGARKSKGGKKGAKHEQAVTGAIPRAPMGNRGYDPQFQGNASPHHQIQGNFGRRFRERPYCNYCRKLGHTRDSCYRLMGSHFQAQGAAVTSGLVCYTCGGYGHKSANCGTVTPQWGGRGRDQPHPHNGETQSKNASGLGMNYNP